MIGIWTQHVQSSMVESIAERYVTYTSYKYKIQFQYPTDWVQAERISSNDEGADIRVTEQGYAQPGMILIIRGNRTGLESDLMTEINKMENTIGNFFPYELAFPISQTTIGGQEAATLIYSLPGKGYDKELEPIHQIWMIYVGKIEYYLILFTAPRYSFGNTENTEIRNQFIQSIKFLN
jgi:hypothetical protein